MTSEQKNTPVTDSLLKHWLANGKELPPHLKPALEKLSTEHISGISLSQLESPMMKQFRAAKDEVPDALLFFRMGDFFELFGIDAIIVSDICGLTLTSRDKSSNNPVPMAGSPVVGYKNALKKCVLAGFKVAVCDQVEDPRQVKGIVKREITRIATPAVPGDLDDDDNSQETPFGCYLASVIENKKTFTLAYVDVSTGEFRITQNLNELLLNQELSTITPREILVPKNIEVQVLEIVKKNQKNNFTTVNTIENWLLRSADNCKEIFLEFFKEKDLNAFGLNEITNGLTCVSAILHYLKATQKSVLKNIQFITYYDLRSHLIIDDSTRKHLDFFQTTSGDKKGSLFHFLNKCTTATGSRKLFRRLNYPFKYLEEIEQVHQNIQEYINQVDVVTVIIENLRNTADIDRLLARAAQKNLDARGMAWLRETLLTLPNLETILNKLTTNPFKNNNLLVRLEPLKELLMNALNDEPAAVAGKGGIIFKEGYSKKLDEAIALTTNFSKMLDTLEQKEKENSQITTLKIGYTGAFGYYFEISKGKIAQAPKHFIRKQTLTNCERYITPELKELEEKSLNASDERILLEKELLEFLRTQILEYSQYLVQASELIAEIDLSVTFANLALQFNWCRPALTNKKLIKLTESTHPILAHLSTRFEPFIANDITLGVVDDETKDNPLVHLITGPNMAGKSTIMRQVAVTQVLCQIGSYVPARKAEIGLVDRIFTRIGSGDNALKNQSTFMVEMLETANMLRFATPQSLLLLDEIGRGTSTFDGLSIAWSILENLSEKVQARALFSTHYHELQEVCASHKNICPMHMSVVENIVTYEENIEKKEILFSRKYTPGGAGKSYGLHVAELAGIPAEIIARAEDVLKKLENSAPTQTNVPATSNPESFKEKLEEISESLKEKHLNFPIIPEESGKNSNLTKQATLSKALLALDVDGITPRQALEIIYTLKNFAAEHSGVEGEQCLNLLKILAKQQNSAKKQKERLLSHEQTLF
ncbi:DNA mismatch repair protein MutS [Fluviispira sanaruensis]|uniref:DNA mismatch repair protein MutS n=1 Tax=Fluviispira sanaruensis TaxID=2493639 RepID=A0A4P2VUN2_FLUSA|nr:DNA mismatch repair protein MutS [Fluviispira sanaruensis]BBH52582.1 DNA mismatch repair protein MutS [Fluviispira sanaruensis]